MPNTVSLSRVELSDKLKDQIGYTLDIKPSQIQHKEAGEGLFLRGHADVGSVIAFYPGVIYSPAYYRYIPGYPRVDARNSYLITRYDSTIINGQPWGHGGEHRELWDGVSMHESFSDPAEIVNARSDRFWKLLSKPTRGIPGKDCGEILERRNPLAFGHFANHPAERILPNVMVCPYDFPLTDAHMRPYIPNLTFGGEENVRMRRFGSFWFKSGGGSEDSEFDVPIIKSIVLVATRSICDEEIYLNYRLSNAKRQPSWYTPVDEEEDKRRWS